MRFLAGKTLTPSTEIKTLQDRKTDRFRENRMNLGRLRFKCPRDLLSQNSLSTMLRLLTLEKVGKRKNKQLSRKGTTQEKKPPEMNIISP